MARPKKTNRPVHLHIDPYVYEGESERVDRALAWFREQPAGQRTKLAWNLIVAACNGELGVAPGAVMDGDDDSAENKSALNELLRNMAFEEE